MKNELHLMERIHEGSEGASRKLAFSKERYIESVTRHLEKMFNVRQGSCPASPDFGLPDFNDLEMADSFVGAVKEISNAIKENIEKFEPGLSRVKVNYRQNSNNPLLLEFEVVARLNVNGRLERVKFETTKQASGQIKVNN